jgi:cobalt-zinc-cadmium efflux system protein
MAHTHHHAAPNYNRAFAIGVSLNIVFVAIEATYGILTDSLALVADAGHNLSDVLSLLLAWGANVLATRKPTPRRSYGFRRATILASLLSGILLLMALGAIAWEAIGRLDAPRPVSGVTIIVVAGIGVLINAATALLFLSGRKRDLNIRGAYLHMAADAGVSLGVLIAGVAIMFSGWLWLDPTISLCITVIILLSTWGLLRDSLNLALDSVPGNIDPMAVEAYLSGLPTVAKVHDLHIWAMSTTEVALTAHLVVPQLPPDDSFLHRVSHTLHDQFGIEHATLQIERGEEEEFCKQAHPESV